jgi:hypothetical protein
VIYKHREAKALARNERNVERGVLMRPHRRAHPIHHKLGTLGVFVGR